MDLLSIPLVLALRYLPSDVLFTVDVIDPWNGVGILAGNNSQQLVVTDD